MLNSCYWGKTLNTNQKIKISADFSPLINNNESSVYVNNNTSEEYRAACVNKLKSELQTYNATIVENDMQTADFTIIIERMSLKETSKSETVNDQSSPYNGKTYYLVSCNVDVEFKLYKGDSKTGKFIGKYYINTEKEEKITNNRSLGDYMFGQNKDNSEYRQKLLPDDIFLRLCRKAGSRISGKTTNKISKNL